MRSRLVILDANVIIEAFRLSFWESIVNTYDVHVASTVIHVEVTHYRNENQEKVDINLKPLVESGKIKEITAESSDLISLEDKMNPNMLDLIHDGEKEVIALMNKGDLDEHLFCTGDIKAIKVISALGRGTQAISLEDILTKINKKDKLPNQSYSKRKFELSKAEGLQEQDIILKRKK